MKRITVSITDEQYEGIQQYLKEFDNVKSPKKKHVEFECTVLLECAIQNSGSQEYIEKIEKRKKEHGK